MPTYPYVCRECKKKFEIVRSVAEYKPASVKCPKCGKKKVERVWSGVFVGTSKKS